MRHGPLQFVFSGICAVLLSLPATAAVGATAPPGTGTGQSQGGGYRVGEKVQVNTGFGWVTAQILKIDGNRYYVHTGAGDIWKYYPAEVRGAGLQQPRTGRTGTTNSTTECKCTSMAAGRAARSLRTMGQDYQIKLAGNRETWATPENMRYAGSAAAGSASDAGRCSSEAGNDELCREDLRAGTPTPVDWAA